MLLRLNPETFENLELGTGMLNRVKTGPKDVIEKVSVFGLISESMENWPEKEEFEKCPSYTYGHPRGQKQYYYAPQNKDELSRRVTATWSKLAKEFPDFYSKLSELDLELFRGRVDGIKNDIKIFIAGNESIKLESEDNEVVIFEDEEEYNAEA